MAKFIFRKVVYFRHTGPLQKGRRLAGGQIGIEPIWDMGRVVLEQ